MPLVAHNKLPTFERLRREGEIVLAPDRALQQDIRELHIGLLNMMPDAALAATERQFFRLVGESNQIAQFYMHVFTVPQLERGNEASEYISTYYETFERLKVDGLDALIITGANVTQPDLAAEPFWQPLIEVVEWGLNNVASVLCSCLATHAVMHFHYKERRTRMPAKKWGVYQHHLTDNAHPLVVGVNTRFDVPHSRFNDVSRAQFEKAGLKVLAESPDAGVHLAVSEDLLRIVCFQGHPEYDTNSLLKEYKREVMRFARGEEAEYPPTPQNYFSLRSGAILNEYRDALIAAKRAGRPIPEFPESLIAANLDNTWHDTAEAIINNWVGLVYQTTNFDRRLQYADGIDPNNPLGLR